jgi:hypothetical protein
MFNSGSRPSMNTLSPNKRRNVILEEKYDEQKSDYFVFRMNQ